jgi:glycosyltransferase involved in cell wall biosynthesis
VLKPNVAILLTTFNGQSYLQEQLESIFNQTYSNYHLWISDDGSIDNTLQIIDFYKTKFNNLTILNGPRRGFNANFFELTNNRKIKADYYFWADQDDIWFSNKIERAVSILQQYDAKTPSLYSCNAIIIDKHKNIFGYTYNYQVKKFNFANSLVQPLAGGNTMCFNSSARDLICLGVYSYPAFYDWWAYQIISGCDGNIIFDDNPMIYYRQHDHNLIGVQPGIHNFRKKLNRFLYLDKQQNSLNIDSLLKYHSLLSEANQKILNNFIELKKNKFFIYRLYKLKKSGIFRRTLFSQLSLYLSSILGLL